MGKLYAMGGRILGDGVRSEDMDERISDFNRVEMYNPVTDSWSIRAPMLEKRSGFAAAVNNGIIYIFGGEGVKRSLNSVEKYNRKMDRWSFESFYANCKVWIKAVSFEDQIFVIGGQLVDAFGSSSIRSSGKTFKSRRIK